MTPRGSVKPLTHWLIYMGYTVRFRRRTPGEVAGFLTTPAGRVDFTYTPSTRIVALPDRTVHLDEYGWEIAPGATQPPPVGE